MLMDMSRMYCTSILVLAIKTSTYSVDLYKTATCGPLGGVTVLQRQTIPYSRYQYNVFWGYTGSRLAVQRGGCAYTVANVDRFHCIAKYIRLTCTYIRTCSVSDAVYQCALPIALFAGLCINLDHKLNTHATSSVILLEPADPEVFLFINTN